MAAERESSYLSCLDDILEKIEHRFNNLIQRAPWDFPMKLQIHQPNSGSKPEDAKAISMEDGAMAKGAPAVPSLLGSKEINTGMATPSRVSPRMKSPRMKISPPTIEMHQNANLIQHVDLLSKHKQVDRTSHAIAPKYSMKLNTSTLIASMLERLGLEKRPIQESKGDSRLIMLTDITPYITFETLQLQLDMSLYPDKWSPDIQYKMEHC